MPARLELTEKFFERTLDRDFAEAERILMDIRDKMSSSHWSQGYFLALQGMLTAYKGKDDRYALINRLDPTKNRIPELEKEFYMRSKSVTDSDLDRGFFSAWTDLLRFVPKNKVHSAPEPQSSVQKSEPTDG